MKTMTKPIDDYDPRWPEWNAMNPNELRSVGADATDGDGGGDEPVTVKGDEAPADGGAAEGDTEEKPAEEAVSKGEDEDDKAEGYPEKGYEDFSMPEGMDLDKDALAEVEPFLKDNNMSQAKAQQLVDVYAGLVQKQQEAVVSQWNETQTKWTEESTKAGLFEGEAQASIKAGFDAYEGGTEFQEVLGQYFLDKNPAVRKFLHAVGKSVQDDTDTPTPEGSADDNSEEARLRKRYPSMYPDK